MVIADCCNPEPLTRGAWHEVARQAGVPFVDIEVICSDVEAHRRRVEERSSTVPGLRLPTWQQVLDRGYVPWSGPRLVADTAGRTVEACLAELLVELDQAGLRTSRQK